MRARVTPQRCVTTKSGRTARNYIIQSAACDGITKARLCVQYTLVLFREDTLLAAVFFRMARVQVEGQTLFVPDVCGTSPRTFSRITTKRMYVRIYYYVCSVHVVCRGDCDFFFLFNPISLGVWRRQNESIR